jgi:hypothetical protein
VDREVVEEVQDDELGFLDALEEDEPAGFENLVKLRTSSGSSTYTPLKDLSPSIRSWISPN